MRPAALIASSNARYTCTYNDIIYFIKKIRQAEHSFRIILFVYSDRWMDGEANIIFGGEKKNGESMTKVAHGYIASHCSPIISEGVREVYLCSSYNFHGNMGCRCVAAGTAPIESNTWHNSEGYTVVTTVGKHLPLTPSSIQSYANFELTFPAVFDKAVDRRPNNNVQQWTGARPSAMVETFWLERGRSFQKWDFI